MIKNVGLSLLALGGLFAVLHSMFGGKDSEGEAVEAVQTPQDVALAEKERIRKAMQEMGRKGGKASAEKRKKKKEGQSNEETEGE